MIYYMHKKKSYVKAQRITNGQRQHTRRFSGTSLFHPGQKYAKMMKNRTDSTYITCKLPSIYQAFHSPPWVGNLPESHGKGKHTSCQHSCQRRTQWVLVGEAGESWWSFLEQIYCHINPFSIIRVGFQNEDKDTTQEKEGNIQVREADSQMK